MNDTIQMKDMAEPQGGFAQLVGYRLTKWEPDYAEVELDLLPRHLNRSGVPHGGVIPGYPSGSRKSFEPVMRNFMGAPSAVLE